MQNIFERSGLSSVLVPLVDPDPCPFVLLPLPFAVPGAAEASISGSSFLGFSCLILFLSFTADSSFFSLFGFSGFSFLDLSGLSAFSGLDGLAATFANCDNDFSKFEEFSSN